MELHAFLATFYERYANCTSQIRRWVTKSPLCTNKSQSSNVDLSEKIFLGYLFQYNPFSYISSPSIRENQESLRRVIQLPSKTTRLCSDTETSATSPLNTKVLTENLRSVLRVGVARERYGSSEVKMNQNDGLSKLCWLFTYSRGGRLCV